MSSSNKRPKTTQSDGCQFLKDLEAINPTLDKQMIARVRQSQHLRRNTPISKPIAEVPYATASRLKQSY